MRRPGPRITDVAAGSQGAAAEDLIVLDDQSSDPAGGVAPGADQPKKRARHNHKLLEGLEQLQKRYFELLEEHQRLGMEYQKLQANTRFQLQDAAHTVQEAKHRAQQMEKEYAKAHESNQEYAMKNRTLNQDVRDLKTRNEILEYELTQARSGFRPAEDAMDLQKKIFSVCEDMQRLWSRNPSRRNDAAGNGSAAPMNIPRAATVSDFHAKIMSLMVDAKYLLEAPGP